MSDLARKGQTRSLGASLEAVVKAKVPQATRKLALETVEWFDDKPTQNGLNEERAALKLAWHFHRLEVTAEEVMPLLARLDEESQFRPKVADILKAIREARRHQADAALAEKWGRMIELRNAAGVPMMCRPENVAGFVEEGWTLDGAEAEKLRSLGFDPPAKALPAPAEGLPKYTEEQRAELREQIFRGRPGLPSIDLPEMRRRLLEEDEGE